MNNKSLIASLTGVALFLGTITPAQAYNMPEFGSCLNPQWSKTQENKGSDHGVIGVGTYAGTDTIYESNGNVLQCLTTDTGTGYQTNWLKATNLSTDEMKELESKGWIYVAHGEDWGLEKCVYMAKNGDYTSAATSTPTPVASPDVTPTPAIGGSDSTPTTSESASTSETQTSVPVLGGLAPTGNALTIYLAILAGIASISTGIVLRKFSK
ncbi:MAG: hypothetical protein H0W89_02140 [Candidatus Levybacteria bacterium]|nr:hypothetical protein [Candidatus Levybacteria bacterium]